jgi:hypothetical protein
MAASSTDKHTFLYLHYQNADKYDLNVLHYCHTCNCKTISEIYEVLTVVLMKI